MLTVDGGIKDATDDLLLTNIYYNSMIIKAIRVYLNIVGLPVSLVKSLSVHFDVVREMDGMYVFVTLAQQKGGQRHFNPAITVCSTHTDSLLRESERERDLVI